MDSVLLTAVVDYGYQTAARTTADVADHGEKSTLARKFLSIK
jgi:hypothetical protein